MIKLNYIQWIQENEITIYCDAKEYMVLLKKLGAKRKFFQPKIWTINCKDESDLARKLQILNDEKFMFAGGVHGWNPVDIFILLREKKLVFGKVMEIFWTGPNKTLTRFL